jgi:hypothetical protein
MHNVLLTTEDAAEAPFNLLDRAMLSVEGHQRLLDYVVGNHPEARGDRATREDIATGLFEEMKTNCRRAVEAFRDAAAPSREAEVVARLQEFMSVAIPLLESASFEPLGRELVKFSFIRNILSKPVPSPSPADEARRVLAAWGPLEADFLAAELREGDTPLANFDSHKATTKSGRVISRKELREKYRPGSWSRTDTWFAQFPEIPAEQE